MAVKLYELSPTLFEKLESIYPNLTQTEITKLSFLHQILLESGCAVEVEVDEHIDFVIKFGRLTSDRLDKIQKLGYKILTGRIRVK